MSKHVCYSSICPLCHNQQSISFSSDSRRSYYRCTNCQLVFVPPSAFVSTVEEQAIYDQHQNDSSDADYRNFLNRMCAPICKLLPAGASGLDFGSGPGPTLSVMFSERGYKMRIYDQFYADDRSVWQEYYDFITATEVVEHLRDPHFELNRLWHHVKPGGVLGLMTKMVTDSDAFSRWHYKNDPTHICFFSVTTFMWLAQYWGAAVEFYDNDVVTFFKHDEVSC